MTDRRPIPPPPPERQRPVNFRGRTRQARARKTVALAEARKVDPVEVLNLPQWCCRWTSPLGAERVRIFGNDKQGAMQLAKDLAHYSRTIAVVEQIVPPQGEPE